MNNNKIAFLHILFSGSNCQKIDGASEPPLSYRKHPKCLNVQTEWKKSGQLHAWIYSKAMLVWVTWMILRPEW